MSNAMATFAETTADGLHTNYSDATAYRLSPAKGARVSGRVLVRMTSHTTHGHGAGRARPNKVTCPAMWVDLTPSLADDGTARELLTVNGREYGAGFGNWMSATVELEPRQEHLDQYYPTLTVDAIDYHVKTRFNMFDKTTDAFRKVVGATLAAIALEYITDERWHAVLVSSARRRVESAQRDADDANAKLAAAQAELAALVTA